MGMLFILDRDGVINFESKAYVKSPEEWHPIPGSINAIAQLSQRGDTVVIATNQSGVGRGIYDLNTLDAIHAKMQKMVTEAGGVITKIYYCPHSPDDHCDCRKPQPGMLKQIQKEFQIEPADMIVVGDSFRDLQAGKAIGCQLILVKTGNGKKTLRELTSDWNVLVFDDLQSVVENFKTS